MSHLLAKQATPFVGLLLIAALLAATATPSQTSRESRAPSSGKHETTTIGVAKSYCNLPLAFEVNQGQMDAQVKFLSRGSGFNLYLNSTDAVLALRRAESPATDIVRMKFLGANPDPELTGLKELPGRANYFIGSDPEKWRTNIPTYARVEYSDLYPGIDLVYYGVGREIEYDLIVAPGSDPQVIRIAFEGVDSITVDPQGDLVLTATGGEVRLRRPVIYQDIDETRKIIAGHYVLHDGHQVGFEVTTYDPEIALIIDPVLDYSTYLGGSSFDIGLSIAVDIDGNAYVAGRTSSTDFPTKDPLQPVGNNEAFVSKLNSAGTALVYSTYLGGSGLDIGRGVAVDLDGCAYVAGQTTSSNFPTVNPFQAGRAGGQDIFVSKLSADGSALLYSTYLGGTGLDEARGSIAVDSSKDVVVTGFTDSPDFPMKSAYQPVFGGGLRDAFVVKFDPSQIGSASLLYSTYLGGSELDQGLGVAVDGSGNAHVTGNTSSANFPTASPLQAFSGGGFDAFVTKFNPGGSALLYSTYLGGSGNESGHGIAADPSGNTYVTGEVGSTDFPTVNPLQAARNGVTDAFVTKLNQDGSTILYSTYLGGSGTDFGTDIAVDASESAYVTGVTQSIDFPILDALQPSYGGGTTDGFVTKLNPGGSAFDYSTYLGGSGADNLDFGGWIAVDGAGNAYLTGVTQSVDFPTANPLQPVFAGIMDAYVTKISEQPILAVTLDIKPRSCPNTLNAASGGALPVAIAGTADFDVSQIDPNSLLLEGVVPTHVALKDVTSTPPDPTDDCDCEGSKRDRVVDLVLKFDRQALIAALGPLQTGDVLELTLTGHLVDGTSILGKDCVRIIAKNTVPSQGAEGIQSDAGQSGRLLNVYPNPMRAGETVSLAYRVPEGGAWVSIGVYNAAGQKVTALSNSFQAAGNQALRWSGRDDTGSLVAQGVYFMRIKIGATSLSRVVIVR